ncbi:non-ribosomal peptide synthetase [Ketobacter sp.]|uniref:non-ribosomal peptide synthetase n=1 Tax=Ketobacter sp. TaxID=2083498 RepID=UPI000F23FD15|nr:non-ribosomal peptide synthetase [Ketobacter sp.]RLT97979.1 MAG: non-ribosomal peptide synthetase [Ketobacter sp.]
MNVLDLLTSLRKANIQISLVDDKLKIKAPKGAVTPEIKQQLGEAKQEIMDFLREAAAPVQASTSIPVIERSGELALSYTQAALWTLDQMSPGSIAYNLPMAFKFFGGLDVAILERAITTVIERHEVLRLVVRENDSGEPYAHIHQPGAFQLPVHDLVITEHDHYDAEIKAAVEHYALQPFDLAAGPLYRFDLVQVRGGSELVEAHDLLVVCLHHIISDGLSQNLLVREIAMLYAAFVQGAPSPLPELPVQFLDYAAWQRQRLTGDKLEQELAFWKSQLRGVPALLALPTDRPRPIIQSSNGARYHFSIPPVIATAVIKTAQEQGHTVFMALMAALQMVLSRHARQTDFCIGMPTAGRHLQEVENLIGFFVNGVLVRADLKGNPTWKHHLDNVKQRLMDVLSHQETPAQLIIDHLDVPRNPSYPPLAQVGFQLQNFSGSVQAGRDEAATLDAFRSMTNLSMEPVKLEEADSKFDMIVSVAQNETDLSGYVEYNTDLFDESTISRLMAHFNQALNSMLEEPEQRLENIQLDSQAALSEELGLAEGEQLCRLTTTQMAFVQDIELRPETRQYAVGFRYAIPKPVDHALLQRAINHVIQSHGALRARFVRCDLPWADSAYQVFRTHHSVELELIDLGGRDDADAFVARHFDQWCYRAHDIFANELIRFQLMVSGDQSWLLLSCHHIILDGMSGMAMLRKIIQSYEAGLPPQQAQTLPAYDDCFADYVERHHAAVDQASAVKFWQEKSATTAPLVFSKPGTWPSKRDYQILTLPIDDTLLASINAYCRKQKTHPSTLYRLVAALMIQEYCRPESDFVLWDIQSGRSAAEEGGIGVFYQQVPYIIPRDLLAASRNAGEFFSQQRQYRREIKDFTFLSLARLNQLFPAGSLSFQYNYFNFLEPVSIDGVASLPYTFSSHVDNTVQVFVKDYGASLEFELWFDGAVFVPLEFLQRMEQVTRQLVSDPATQFAHLQFDLAAERRQLAQWNDNAEPLTHSTILTWYQDAVTRYPQQIALIYDELSLTYSDLDAVVNQWANLLMEQGVVPRDRVGIFLGRSQWSVIAVLAVLKTGATYIPIESSYPCERVEYILSDSQARLLITERCLEQKLQNFKGVRLTLEEVNASLHTFAAEFTLPEIKAEDPIYAIYTSGSTGKPKGALVAHGGEVNLQRWYTSLCDFGADDRTLIISAFGFDLTQKNLFAPLLCGGAVVIPAMEEFDAGVVAAEIQRHGITHINCAPSALYSIVEDCDPQRARQLQTLRWVFLGGEPIRLSALHQWLQYADTVAQVVNSYGPTECTDVVSFHVLQNIASENQLIPIGKPICNTDLFVLDENLLPAPLGTVGEICIGGAGVGLGYIGRDDLNAEVFVRPPLADGSAYQGLLYRTGDLGRFGPDGNIEYLGRKDFQVKVRGLRIELGEVEAAIKSLPQIEDAVVLVKEDALVGYGLNAAGTLPADWQAQLRSRLPDYMVPAQLVVLAQWPLTPNGKIDRKALPEPATQGMATEFVAPRNDLENSIATIWAQVLKLDRVSVEDSFFDLGGHSLLANQIVSRIRKLYDIELPIRDLMLFPTVAQLSGRVLKAQKSEQLGQIVAVSRQQRIPLSASQQRLWLLDRIDAGNPAYHVPSVVTVRGAIQVKLIQAAFRAVVNRNEGLRTIFAEDEQGPYQQFLSESDWQLTFIDGRNLDESALKQQVSLQVLTPFQLDQGPLFRGAIIQRAENEHLLVVVLHHIITDGWSNALLVRQLGEVYVRLLSGGATELPAPSLHYADYAVWQQEYLAHTLDTKMAFWQQSLADVATLELPLDYKRPPVQTFAGASIQFTLGATVSAAMNALCNRFQMTPFMVLLAAYGALLQRYSGQERFAVGTPVAGRERPELEDVVGFFVNTVAVPLAPESSQSFSQLLEQVKQTALSCFEHQDIPFEQIVEELNPVRDMSRSPIFQVMLAYQDIPLGDSAIAAGQLGTLSLEPYALELNTAKFEQTLTLWPGTEGLCGTLNYNTDLFSASSAQQFVDHLQRFCEQAFQHPERPLHRLEVLSAAERQQQLHEWNQTQFNYTADRIENLFTQAAGKASECIAVSQGDQVLTYAELALCSDAVAATLRRQGVERNAFVGVVSDRNLHLMSVILGVMKAGAVYVPVDGAYPEQRIRYICEQSGIRTLLSLPHLSENLPAEMDVLDVTDLPQWLAEAPDTQSTESVQFQDDDLIYVIYTSGSTGNPKGTGAYHRSEANLLAWYTGAFQMNANDRVLLLSAIGFDLTQKNLFAPLLCGARLVIPEFQEYDPQKIIEVIEREEITWINCAPSAFYPLVDAAGDWQRLASLRYVFLGGEPINLSRISPWLQQTTCQLINSYGPTECADIAAWHAIDLTQDSGKSAIPIGKPNYNVQLYVLGEHQELLPRGAIGELCIGGDGVGPGYLNQAQLTASVFIDNPFQPGSKLYRTGDRVRYQPDGAVVYLGRRDHQIKLRGYRIEAGEIQALANRHEDVKESLADVIRNPSGVDQLVVWVVSQRPEAEYPALISELKPLARRHLPSFMLPDAWVVLPAFTLTANGKIDRKALPQPSWTSAMDRYVAPRNEQELALAEIWAQVLRLDQVGVHDNFFELGGHSLLATQVAARVRTRLGVTLPIRDLMSHPTVAELALRLSAHLRSVDEPDLVPVARDQRLPLSFAQQRLWLLDKIDAESLAYTVPSIIRIRGALKPSILEAALSEVLNRHEGLRTHFGEDEEGPYQKILEPQHWPLPVVDVEREAGSTEEQALLTECKRLLAIELMTPFDLSRGPLFRTRLFRLGADDHVFMVAIHHVVTDGWSMNLLIEDLAQAYLQLDLHGAVMLDRLPIQYADFAQWQRQRLDQAQQQRLLEYWKQQLHGVEPLNLPLDFQRPAVQSYNGKTVRFSIGKPVRDALYRQAVNDNTSLFVSLLSGLFILLRQYSGQNDFCIGTPVAGRERAELEKVVGFFVNTLAIRADVSARETFTQVLQQVKQSVLDGLAHQEMPFEQIVDEVDPARDMSRTPVFQVMLAYQNLPQEQAALSGADRLGDIALEPFDPGVDSSKYELTMTLWESSDGLGGSLQYNSDLFLPATIERMVDHYTALLECVACNPDLPIHQLEFLSAEEREQQLIEWNLTAHDYDRELTLDRALTSVLLQHRERIAVRCGDDTLTYGQLDELSNKVAAALQAQGIKAGDKVAFCLDRNLHLLTVLVGIIKAGATYVPLDASYPKQRLAYILEHADARLVLTQQHLLSALPETTPILVWETLLAAMETLSEMVTPVQVSPEQLLYVIFTSGSTGNPKGTGAYHRSEMNLLNWYRGEFNMVAEDRVLLMSAVGFDLTQKNLFAPLLQGAELVIPHFNEFDAHKLNGIIARHGVTWLNCAPSAFYALQDEPADWPQLASLRLLFLGGEPINVPRLADWLQHSRCQLINSYGPTECADIAAWYPVDVKRDYHAAALPIGRPNYNVQLYVLGDQQELLPTGAIGELYIAGDGVGPGYINNPEQTQAAFLANVYAPSGAADNVADNPSGKPSENATKFYRTGDRVRYRADGNVEYLGRRDHQIKLRGYRIEAGEIQSVLNHVDAVKDSLVDVLKETSGQQRLVAWVVVTDTQADWEPVLKQACLDRLPAFMVPDAWVMLERFPLTPNGKVDRKALPEPQLQSEKEHVAPATEQEATLCKLWEGVLGVQPVGVTDNFFQLGGQSLLATRLVSRMSRTLGMTIPVRKLFEHPTIRSLLRQLEQQPNAQSQMPVTRRPEPERAPLSFGQQRLWFFEQMNPGTQANNMPVAVRIKGHLDDGVLEKAFAELIRRHESLRTCFDTDESGNPIQQIQQKVPFVLQRSDLSALGDETKAAQLNALITENSRTPISLLQAPLLRAHFIRTHCIPNHADSTASESSEQMLLLCMHHIISDGASQVVLFRELMTLYLAFISGQPSPLPELTIHYPDFAYWQRQRLDDQSMAQQLQYWKQQLQGVPALLDLPLDKPRPKVQTAHGATVNATLPEPLTQNLLALCEQAGVTPFMATLLAWQVVLYRFSGQPDIVVGVPTLGRNSPELEGIIGFFIQSLVLRARFDRNPLLSQALGVTKETVLEGFSNGDVPVDKIVEHLGIARNPSYSPLVQVAFQLLDSAGFNTAQLAEQARIGDMEVEILGSETASAKFDLTLNLTLDGDQLNASLEYNTDLFVESTAQALLSGFENVCSQLVEAPDTPVAAVDLLASQQLLQALDLDSATAESVQPLSAMQYDMFMDNLVNPDSLQSSHGWNIHIHRRLDVELWQRALRTIVEQQPMLRARFVASQKASLDMGYLVIDKQTTPQVQLIDKSDVEFSDAELAQLINRLVYKPYHLQRDPLVSYYVVKLGPEHFVVVTAAHHAILDGASLNVLWSQWTQAYERLAQQDSYSLSAVPYADFVAVDRHVMDTAPVLQFWQEKLATVEPLAFTVPSPVPAASHFVTRELYLEDSHWDAVKGFCRSRRITPALYFKCLFGFVVQQYCRADTDFSIQETMGGRIKGHHEALGCYIQEIPFVFNKGALSSDQRFVDLLEYARQFQKSIKDFRLISIGKQLQLSPKGRIGFMYNFYQFLGQTEFLGESFSPEGTPSDPANNVQFVVTEVAGRLKLNLFYHRHLFADLGMLQRIRALSHQVLAQADVTLAELNLVTEPGERLRLLESWNDTRRDYDLSLCVHQKFEVQVQRTPGALAITDDQGALTYLELNQRANQLAHYLMEHGVRENHLVGLCAERSCDFLVGILGILKAGGAYVPMDPKYPDDRIDYMIQNSDVGVLITQQHLLPKSDSAPSTLHRVCLDRDWPQIASGSMNNPNLPLGPRNRAYMIYTSGSTGLPKGAIVRHDGAINHIEAECEVLGFADAFSFLQTAPASSDISVWQFVGPITRGGQVVVLDDVTHSRKLFQKVQQHQVDVVELVPVALQLLMEYVRQLPQSERELPSLRWMMATGEAVSVELVNDWLELFPNIPVVNAYGPTEAADDVIQCSIRQPLPATQKSVPIGRPLGNLRVYILDPLLRLVPPGVPGEICIGGIGVGEGYWRNPDKTAAAFVADPYCGQAGAKMYRTGDLGRWLADGTVEYLDRVDNQVKVRGFRIELGEVEAALSALPGVRENVVIVRDDLPGGKALAAYVVAGQGVADQGGHSGPNLDPQRLRAQLRESLPDFMVPAAITVMDALPLTPAGKIDRKALPRPVAIQLGGAEYVAPRNDVESALVTIWESFMPVERIGVTDNFFELGGHSLVGVRIMAKVNKTFGLQLQVAALLTTQTIEKLAQLIQGGQGTDDLLVPIEVSDRPPLFMIHPIGGDVLCYADLARALRNQYSVYGLRAQGLDGTQPPLGSLAEMTERYVGLILNTQPQGPYSLLGQSIGGIFAWAVAARLEALGHQVADVVMLDTYSPQHLRGTRDSGAALLGKALGVPLANPDEVGTAKSSEETEAYLTRIHDLSVQAGVLPAEMSRAQFAALYAVVLQNHTIASQYEVEKIAARVHHFTASANVSGGHSGATWQGLLPEPVSHEVDGGHESMMQGALAVTLAESILDRLHLDNNNNE